MRGAHDIVMETDYSPAGKKGVIDALKFFMDKRGNLEIVNGDGLSAKRSGMSVQRLIPKMGPLLNSGNVLFGHGQIRHSRATRKNISDSEEANGGSALGNRWTR